MRISELLEAVTTYNNSYLQGDYVRIDDRTHESRIEFLNANLSSMKETCSEIINVYQQTDRFLYRGMKRKPNVFLSNIRQDRSTIQMPRKFAELLVAAYTAFGIDANRQNSIFTSPIVKTAGHWGEAYIVFPFNGFKFSYVAKYDTMYPFADLYELSMQAQSKEKPMQFMIPKLEEMGLTDENLPYAIENNLEVLITGDKFYAFSFDTWADTLSEWLGLTTTSRSYPS